MELLVFLCFFQIAFSNSIFFNKSIACFLYRRINSSSNSGQNCCTVCRSLFLLQCMYIAFIKICHNLSPYRTSASTSACTHGYNLCSQFLQDFITVCKGINNTFHNCPKHMCLSMYDIQSDKCTSVFGINMRCSFAHQEWKVNQSFASYRNIFCKFIYLVIK